MAGIVVGEVGDDAAGVGDLRRLAERVVDVIRRAGVRAGAADHVAEAVAHVGGVERPPALQGASQGEDITSSERKSVLRSYFFE